MDDEQNYNLYYYPIDVSLENIVRSQSYESEIEMMIYSTKDLGTEEAYKSISELYQIVKENLYGMNEILDDIIDDDDLL